MAIAGRRRGRPERTEEGVAQTRLRIAAEAERLFREEGYKAVSMRRVAASAGCSPATLYAYFASKADILRQLWSGIFVDVFDGLDREKAKAGSPDSRLRRICAAYVGYWLANPERYRLVFMTEGVSQAEVGDFIDPAIRARFGLFADVLAEAGAAPDRLKLASETLVSALHGVAQSHITVSALQWESAEAMTGALADAMVWAFGPRPAG